MPQFILPATSPVVRELTHRLHTRLADLKGPYSHTFTPPSTASIGTNGPFDALLLPGTLGLTPHPAEFLNHLLPTLRPEGAVLGWVLGQGSFPQLNAACLQAGFTPPPALPAVQDVGSLLQSLKLALPVIDRDLLTLTFPSFGRMLQHLKAHGALQRPSGSGLLTPHRLKVLEAAYPPNAAGRLELTLEIIFFHALQPAPTLPKAAPRGSGKVPLIKILAPAPSCQTPLNLTESKNK